MSTEAIAGTLESDLRLLSSEARRADGLASQLTGWLSGPEHPQIKEAAERAILRLRSFGSRDDGLEYLRNSKDVLRPFVMAIESKSSKLICLSLVSLQKLVAADAIALDGLLVVIQDMEQVEKMHDEGVQLKVLQTALTLMQSTTLAQNEEGIAMVLGTCFRLLANAKNTDSVTNTAAATVRQAVALVFDHVLVEMQQSSSSMIAEPASPSGASQPGSAKGPETPTARGHGTTNAALKLLDDLCMMATASEGMLKWLKAPTLPRPFVLDLLDFVLANSAAVFRTIPAFEHALLVRVCQLLITQLQNLLDPTCEPALQQADLKIVLRVVRTVLGHFYRQLKSKCGVFIETLLGGTALSCSLWQRISVMQVMRRLCADAYFLNFLYVTYDAKEECKLRALHQMVQRFAQIVDKVTWVTPDSPQDDDAVNTVASLYHSKAHGKEWSMDSDYGTAPAETGAAYLAMLSIDSLLNVVAALEKLTDVAVDGVVVTPDASAVGGKQEVDKDIAVGMCQTTWKIVLTALSQLLARSSSEEIILHLLKGYQSFTQALGVLEVKDARDAFLSSLCSFALPSKMAEDADLDLPMSPASVTSPSEREGPTAPSKATSGKASAAATDASEGVVLTPKNVHALRTLFNVAHRLHHLLGPAWVLVLDILNTLDRILLSPRTTTQEISNSSTMGARPSDLAILSTAASQLFESTRDMSTDAVTSIMAALREVSSKMTPEAAKQPGQPKLYALVRMVEVVLTNLQRIDQLWPIFLSHVMELLGHPKTSIRNAAVDALAKAVVGALSHVNALTEGSHEKAETDQGPVVGHSSGDKAGSSGLSPSAIEGMLLMAVEKLYKEDRELDVQMGLLRVVLQVLQRHGEQLTTAWESLLELLSVVPQAEEADTVQLAFQSVQLLCSDYMSSLPVQHLRRCVEVAALYGSQQADVNVSLTSISLLWNASDLLGKLYSKARSRSSSRSSLELEPATNGNTGSPGAQLDSDQYQELVRLLYGALQGISSTDNRSEVRNCAVRTLFAVVVSQGNRMSSELWDECLWEILFPLLRSVHHMSATSSREETKGEVLGRLRGVSVKMLMHHSRNSEQKQWDETLVLALSGMGRLLRAHLPLLVPMQAFPQGWEELMLVVESSMAGGRKEVALAAIAVITTVMQAHGTTKAVSRSMWKRAMRAMDVGVEAAASPQCMVPLQARLELVNAIGQLNTAMHEVFEEEDMRQIFRWLQKFLNNPYSEDDQLVPAGTLPPVQKAAFSLFPSLVPLQPPELWPELLDSLIQLLKPHLLEGQQQQQQLHQQLKQQQRQGSFNARGPAAPSSNNNSLHRPALSSLSMERALEILLQLYKESAPWQARAGMFCPLITVLGKCMATRYTAYSEGLWRAAAAVFNSVVNCGLPAVNMSYSNQDAEPPTATWQCLAEVFEWFLLGTRVVALDTVATAEALEAAVAAADDSPGGADTAAAAAAATVAASNDTAVEASSQAPAADTGSDRQTAGTSSTDDSSQTAVAMRPSSETIPDSSAASVPVASTSKPSSGHPSRRSSRNPSREPSFNAATGDTQQSSDDADLEASVVDTLTDAVLTACSHAPEDVRKRLISVLDQAIVRPKDRHIPNSAAGIRFSHTCLRKLYVLSSRGVQDDAAATCLLEVAQLTYPVLLARYETILVAYSQHIQRNMEGHNRLQLDETLCVLEVCSAMKIAPAVADAALQASSQQQQVVQLCRQLSRKDRERSHLLSLYGALCSCINSKEHRVREVVRDALQLAGQELSLIAPAPLNDSLLPISSV